MRQSSRCLGIESVLLRVVDGENRQSQIGKASGKLFTQRTRGRQRPLKASERQFCMLPGALIPRAKFVRHELPDLLVNSCLASILRSIRNGAKPRSRIATRAFG